MGNCMKLYLPRTKSGMCPMFLNQTVQRDQDTFHACDWMDRTSVDEGEWLSLLLMD